MSNKSNLDRKKGDSTNYSVTTFYPCVSIIQEVFHTTEIFQKQIWFTMAQITVTPPHRNLPKAFPKSPQVSCAVTKICLHLCPTRRHQKYLGVVREMNIVLTVCVFHWATKCSSVLSPSLLSSSLLRFWTRDRTCARSAHSSLQWFEYSLSESIELWSSSWISTNDWRNLCQASLNSSISFVIFSAPAGDVLAFTTSDNFSMCWRVSSSLAILASSSW